MDPITALSIVPAATSAVQGIGKAFKSLFAKSRPPQIERGQSEQAFLEKLREANTHYLRANDKDGDGLLSAAEFGLDAKRFGSLDANSDGLVSLDEMNAAYASGASDALPKDLLAAYRQIARGDAAPSFFFEA